MSIVERIEFFLSRPSLSRSIQAAPGLGIGTMKGAREENQDRAVITQLSLPTGERYLIALVCDGMGGMARGGEAAACAASNFISHFLTEGSSPLITLVQDAILKANQSVFKRFQGNGGTTLTAVVVKSNGESIIAHVGDSRLYECGPHQSLNLLTRDDTIRGQLQRLADEDELDNRLLQFIGVGAHIEPHIFPPPKGSRSTFLLTSDGAHSIGRKALEGISKHSIRAAELVRKIVFVAEATNVEDNSSVVAITIAEIEPFPRFTNGIELIIWSPSDKLEMWIERPSAPTPAASQHLQKPSPSPLNIANKAKQKKTGKPRAKAAKKIIEQPDNPGDGIGKPQLNIEFGSGEKDNS